MDIDKRYDTYTRDIYIYYETHRRETVPLEYHF